MVDLKPQVVLARAHREREFVYRQCAGFNAGRIHLHGHGGHLAINRRPSAVEQRDAPFKRDLGFPIHRV